MADQDFYRDIERFNQLYRLPCNDKPTALGIDRLKNFKDILAEEVTEVDDMIAKYGDDMSEEARLALLTDVSDWLGDIVVYCASEAKRWGIPLNDVLRVIMDSNFSKLGADGLPIYDERGKVMKGPGYWKPEPKIREVLTQLDASDSPSN
jgi:hypothetical protein